MLWFSSSSSAQANAPSFGTFLKRMRNFVHTYKWKAMRLVSQAGPSRKREGLAIDTIFPFGEYSIYGLACETTTRRRRCKRNEGAHQLETIARAYAQQALVIGLILWVYLLFGRMFAGTASACLYWGGFPRQNHKPSNIAR